MPVPKKNGAAREGGTEMKLTTETDY